MPDRGCWQASRAAGCRSDGLPVRCGAEQRDYETAGDLPKRTQGDRCTSTRWGSLSGCEMDLEPRCRLLGSRFTSICDGRPFSGG